MENTGTSELARTLIALRGASQAPRSLRTVAVVDEVEYLDDGASTTPEAALLSLLHLGKPLVWVADAALIDAVDTRMVEFLREHVDGLVFFGTAEHARVEALHAELGGVYHTGDLRTAVFAARELATSGGRVLFSPACPSGEGPAGQQQREAIFKQAVNDL